MCVCVFASLRSVTVFCILYCFAAATANNNDNNNSNTALKEQIKRFSAHVFFFFFFFFWFRWFYFNENLNKFPNADWNRGIYIRRIVNRMIVDLCKRCYRFVAFLLNIHVREISRFRVFSVFQMYWMREIFYERVCVCVCARFFFAAWLFFFQFFLSDYYTK